MGEIAPVETGATAQSPATKIAEPDVSASSRSVPGGDREPAVHADPTPLAAATQQPVPFISDGTRQEHTDRIRWELSGTGGLVDVVV